MKLDWNGVDRVMTGLVILLMVLVPFLAHEQTHLYIAEVYGCQDYELQVFPDTSRSSTLGAYYDCRNLDNESIKSHWEVQKTVETAGYQIMVIGIPLLLIGFYTVRKLQDIEKQIQVQSSV